MKTFMFALSLVFLATSCSYFQAKDEKTAPELASEGMDAFKDGKYRKSIEQFEKLKNWYPFSKYAILAELKKADAHYFLKEYEEAIFAYEEFENLHPQNEAVPYVIYQIGRCYFDQTDTIDRDQESARKALDVFNRLNKQYPADPYAKKARAHMKKCYKSLAEHELYVGLFYMKKKRYAAAKERFLTVLQQFPDVGVHQKAIRYIAECETVLAGK
ncbi:MAG: outer membrane protein assembly factor BamD [Thermodesulfobacteriota bacterium]